MTDRNEDLWPIEAHVPDELLQLAQWVVWRLEERDGKPTKVPYSARTGNRADSTDPGTWSPFEDAARTYVAGDWSGVGFVFSEHDPYCGVDFDHCVTDGAIDPAVLGRLQDLDGYTEFSQSGTGVHAIVRAKLPAGRRRVAGLEMYDAGRFFVMTGAVVDGFERFTVPDRQEQLTALHLAIFGAAPEPTTAEPAPAAGVDLDDDALLLRMMGSRNGAALRKLWEGDTSDHGDDESAADLALCNHLAFWTGRDAARMDRLFRQSSLFRPKWDRNARSGETYGQGTLRMAIEGTHEVYTPAEPAPVIIYPSPHGSGPAPAGAPPVDADRLLLAEGKNDLGNAMCAVHLHGRDFLYTDSFGWLHWTGTHWHGDAAEAKMHTAMVGTLKARCIAGVKGESNELVKAAIPSAKHTRDALYHLRHILTVSSSEFDAVPHLLNTLSGVVDLRTGSLVTHDPSNRFTYCVPVEYEPGARSELWDTLLLDWFNQDHELILYAQRALGYSTTGETKEECAFYLHGPGRAGKGTLVNTVTDILGHDLARGLKFDIFTDASRDPQGFRWAPLRAVRMVAASESKKAERLEEGLMKQLTGGDKVEAAHKFHASFSFTPTFKIWLMSNHPPRGDVDDAAFWGRFRLLTMTKSHQGTENNGLKDALHKRENLRGVLAWLVAGAMLWYERGLQTPTGVWTAGEKVRREQDNVWQWLQECTEPTNESLSVNLNELYASYTTWCQDAGTAKVFAKQVLSGKLVEKGHRRQPTHVGGAHAKLIFGLRLR